MPVILTFGSVLLYAILNFLISSRLREIPPSANAVLLNLGGLAFSLAIFLAIGQAVSGKLLAEKWHILIVCGVILCVADILLFTAYEKGGTLFTISIVVALLPVISAAIEAFMAGKYPTVQQIIGYAVVATGITIISR